MSNKFKRGSLDYQICIKIPCLIFLIDHFIWRIPCSTERFLFGSSLAALQKQMLTLIDRDTGKTVL